MSTLVDVAPMLGVRIAAGPLELRGITDDLLAPLADLAVAGIHDTDAMPFFEPWSMAPPDELRRNFAQYHWRSRASFSAKEWCLDLAVLWEGQLAGCQGFSAKSFPVTRTGETGSWLGRAFQGRGIGTAMRQAICAFVIDHLGAAEVTSGAFTDNAASLAVSRKVGYREDGVRRMERRPGELAVVRQLRLEPADLVRGPDLTVEGGDAFRSAIGL